ncbi:biopolymer transporter ExbD, partial [Helicobacter pylori]
ISNKGSFYFDDKEISFENLKHKVSTLAKDTPIVLQGDKKSNLDNFIKVVDLLQTNNLKQLYILVEDKKNQKN